MSTFISHGLTGVLVAKCLERKLPAPLSRRVIFLSAVIAALPDTDVVVYMLFHPEGMVPHRGITHSLAFAVLTSLFAALLCPGRSRTAYPDLFAVFFVAAVSHPILDYLMGLGAPIPLLAPFFDIGFQFPFIIVPVAYFSTTGEGWMALLSFSPALIGLTLELLIFLPLLRSLYISDRARRMQLWSIALVAELFTVWFYNFGL